jgi:hypothetical protein
MTENQKTLLQALYNMPDVFYTKMHFLPTHYVLGSGALDILKEIPSFIKEQSLYDVMQGKYMLFDLPVIVDHNRPGTMTVAYLM